MSVWQQRRARGRRLMVGLLAFAALPIYAAAEEVRDTLGWHIVGEGENFRYITREYLGTPELWRDNWKLNPQILDPDVLLPGQRIRVILEREIPARKAEIDQVSNQVDKNLQRVGWQGATPGDLLRPGDGTRTRANSSTVLNFDDDSSLTLTEHSQVFLKDISTSLLGVKRGSIEIERGQADFSLRAPRGKAPEIEIVVGETISRPKPGASGEASARSRKQETGGSALMVYGGSSEIEAGGAKVAVAQGMGTTVPEGGAPNPPERLLPRPRAGQPGPGSQWSYGNPRFEWQPIRGAESYVLEVCRDAACEGLVRRQEGLGETSWTSQEGLPEGELFWRVTAVSASGLDGYSSRPVSFSVSEPRPDLAAPVVVARLEGAGRISPEGVFYLGQGGSVDLVAQDDAAGVAEVSFRWDNGTWQTYRGLPLKPSGSEGGQRLEYRAEDRLGRPSQTWTLEVRQAVEGPLPPTVSRQ